GWAGLAAEPGGAGVLAAWRQRAAAVRAYGGLTRKLAAAGELTARVDALVGAVLHMHHNRLVGIDRPAEERSYAIARGAIVAHRGACSPGRQRSRSRPRPRHAGRTSTPACSPPWTSGSPVGCCPDCVPSGSGSTRAGPVPSSGPTTWCPARPVSAGTC